MKRENKKKGGHASIKFILTTCAIIFVGMSGLFLYGKFVQAAPFTFVQSSWAGGITANTAVHASNQTGWTEYSLKNDMTAGGTLTLPVSSKNFTDDGVVTTIGGFEPIINGFFNGIDSGTTVYENFDKSAYVGLGTPLYSVGNNPQGVAFDVTNNATWVTNSASNTVTKLDAATGAVIGTYAVGNSPRGVVFDITNNAVWIANSLDSTVTKLNAATGAVIGTYSAGNPRGIAFDVTNNAVWVVDGLNLVTKLDATTGATIGSYAVGTNPWEVTFDITNNAVWVTNSDDNTVSKLDAVSGANIGTYSTGGIYPLGVVFDITNNATWVTNANDNTLTKLNASTGAIVGTYSTGINPGGIDYDITSNVIWVRVSEKNSVDKYNATTGVRISSYTLSSNRGSAYQGVAFDITNNAVWSDIFFDNKVSKIDATSLRYVSTGIFTADVVDYGESTVFNTLSYDKSTPVDTTLTIDVRAGNVAVPDGTWTAWSTNITNGGDISVMSGNQYIQYRANFATTNTAISPVLYDITISSNYWTSVDDGTPSTQGGSLPSGGFFAGGTNLNTIVSGSGAGASVVLGEAPSVPYGVGSNPGGIAFDVTNNALWVLRGGVNIVTKLNATTGAVIGNYSLVDSPGGIAFDVTNNAIWVTNQLINSVTKINAATGAIIGTYSAGISAGPNYITYDITNNAVWIINGDSTVSKLNATTGAPIGGFIMMGSFGVDTVYDVTNNVVWVVTNNSTTLTKINATTGALIGSPISVGFTIGGIAFDVTNNLLWVENYFAGSVYRYNATTNIAVGSPVPIGVHPQGIAFDVSNNMIWASNRGSNNVFKIDASTGVLVGMSIAVGISPMNVAFDITNNSVWVTNTGDTTVSKINAIPVYAASGTFTSSIIDLGALSTLNTLSYNVTTPINTNITMDIRGSVDNITWGAWVTGVSNGGSVAALSGNRYIQYKANLSTTDTAVTPSLDDVTISYSQYQSSGSLTSSVFDSASAGNLIDKLAWIDSGTSVTETLSFQIRSSPDGFSWSDWCGPTVLCDGTSNFLSVDNGVAFVSGHPLKTGGNDRYFQYKAFLFSGGYLTPTLSSVTITYDVTSGSPPPPSGGGSFASSPSALTVAASSVANVNAILNGTVNSNGIAGTTRWFEWGTSALGLINQTIHMPHTDTPSGTTATLSWSGVKGATECKLNGGQYVNKVVSCAGGSITTDVLTVNTTYTLTASNGFGPDVTKSLNVVLP
ncbi:MAG: hypothetical protein WC847_00540 [Candidatus Paceibacterota bacterium]|jgi:YVTN family beta-propeller protein